MAMAVVKTAQVPEATRAPRQRLCAQAPAVSSRRTVAARRVRNARHRVGCGRPGPLPHRDGRFAQNAGELACSRVRPAVNQVLCQPGREGGAGRSAGRTRGSSTSARSTWHTLTRGSAGRDSSGGCRWQALVTGTADSAPKYRQMPRRGASRPAKPAGGRSKAETVSEPIAGGGNHKTFWVDNATNNGPRLSVQTRSSQAGKSRQYGSIAFGSCAHRDWGIHTTDQAHTL